MLEVKNRNNVSFNAICSDKKETKIKNGVVSVAAAGISYKSYDYMMKSRRFVLKPLAKDIFNQKFDYTNEIQTVLKQNNLLGKLNIIDLNESNKKQVAENLLKNIKQNFNKNIFTRWLGRKTLKNFEKSINATAAGKNAFFSPAHNAVVCNFKEFSGPVFHEIGHKLNKQSKNKIVKFLSKSRHYFAFAAPAVALSSLFIDKKDDKKNIGQFIKNNCGLLTAACFIPTAIEECIANIKGTKLAKNAGITGNRLKYLNKLHRFSALSYCLVPIFAGISIHLANKIQNIIVKGKQKTL